MLLDFYLEGKLFGVKILFQIFLKNDVRKKCINLLRKTFSNNIFRKNSKISICKLDFMKKIVLLDSYFLGFFQPKFFPIFLKNYFQNF